MATSNTGTPKVPDTPTPSLTPSLTPLADQLRDTCCGNLMDPGAKMALVAKLSQLEGMYIAKEALGAQLEDEIVKLSEQIITTAREVFDSTYSHIPIHQEAKWLQLCAELGIEV